MQSTRRNTDRGLRGSDESHDSGHSSANATSQILIEAWLAQKDRFRAVGVGHSRPFPLLRCVTIREFAELYEAHVESQVRPILEKHHIKPAAIHMSRRGSFNKPFTEIEYPHALAIYTRDENPDTWASAAQEIQEAFRHAGIPNEDIEVEICNDNKINYMISHFFAVDANFLADVESVKQDIVDKVTALCGLAWSSIAFHLRSPQFDITAAKLPTVLVLFFDGVTLDFTTIESRLSKTLHHYKAGLKLELLRGSVETTMNPGLYGGICSDPSRKPMNGSSIGGEGNTTEAGSLGGWLQFNPRNGPPKKVGITCHHVVAPGVDKDPTTVEYPAAFVRIATIKRLKSEMKSQTPYKGTKEALEKMQYLHASPVIGKVVAFSGLRKNASNRRMDWALFETPDTYTKNKPPRKSAFQRADQFPEGFIGGFFYTVTKDSLVKNMGVIRPDSWVAKTGRRTGETSGNVNTMKRFVHWDQHKNFCSEEVEVLGLGSRFAEGEDSGSMVMNASGELVGLLIGKESWGVGFVTPIQDIQRDVEHLTGGSLSLE